MGLTINIDGCQTIFKSVPTLEATNCAAISAGKLQNDWRRMAVVVGFYV